MLVCDAKRPRYENKAVTFGRKDVEGTNFPYIDTLVITTIIGQAIISQVLVENESSINILLKSMFDQMKLSKVALMSCITPIHSFIEEGIVPLGVIQLPLTIGTKPKSVKRNVNFVDLDCSSAYNNFIGRPTL